MSESAPELKPASVPEPTEDPWHAAFVEFEKRDLKMVKDFQEEIDTLLVVVRRPYRLFISELTTSTSQAGLFSAVLTAFVVESYQSLQEDLAQTSVDLLRQISRQLANSSVPAAPDSSHFQAQRSDVRVNVCWFVSLLFSLVVALFGIFLKQWMRAYMKWTDVTPDREAVAIRQLRYRGLETWRLGTILTLLPTLLQLSVILFLSGLLLFLWNLDQTVAHVMAVLLAITFFFVAAVTALPAIFKSCPFRSPLSEILAVPFWRVAQYAEFGGSAVQAFIYSGFQYSPDSWHWAVLASQWRDRSETGTSWVKADGGVITHYNNNGDHVRMHIGAMVHLCYTTQSQPLWSAAISAIVAELPAEDLNCYFGCGIPDIVHWNEVWWPVLGHIFRITEKDISPPAYFRMMSRVSLTIRYLPSPTKDSWLRFLVNSKTRVSKSDSPSSVVESYLLCCLGSLESTTCGPYMLAFMDVLKAQCANLQAPQLNGIACLPSWDGDGQWTSRVRHDVLLNELSGLSFPARIVSGSEHSP
jgi:hypothetical protein